MQDEHAGRHLREGVIQLGNGRRFGVDRDTIGVKPCVNLHTALVRFIQHKLQRIVAGVFADFAGQHIGPRQNVRPPERRAVGFHLEKDGVDTQALQVIEFGDQRQLLLRDAAFRRAGDNRPDRRPVKARHGGEPHAAYRLPVRLAGFDGGSVRCRDKGFRGLTGAAEQHAHGNDGRTGQRHFAG